MQDFLHSYTNAASSVGSWSKKSVKDLDSRVNRLGWFHRCDSNCDLSFVWRVRVSFEVFLCFVRIRRSNCSTVPGFVDVDILRVLRANGEMTEPDYLVRWIDWKILARRSLSIIQRRPDRLLLIFTLIRVNNRTCQ